MTSLIEKVARAQYDAEIKVANAEQHAEFEADFAHEYWGKVFSEQALAAIQVVLREMKQYRLLDLEVEHHLWEMEIENFAREHNIDLSEPKP